MAKLAVPQTVAEMQEIMNTPAKVAEWVQAGQFSEVVDAYNRATAPDTGEQIAQHLRAFFDGESIVENKVAEALTNWQREHGVPNRPKLDVETSNNRHGAAYNRTAPGVALDDAGFVNLGDFAQSVFNKGPHAGRADPRMAKVHEVMNAYSTNDPSLGGFLIPETMRSEVMDLALEQEIVRPRASVIDMTTLTQSIPYVDQTTHVGSVFGGISFTRHRESESTTPTEAKFGRVKLSATDLLGLARVPNSLWADAPALSTWLMAALPRGIAFYEDVDYITGSGANEPLGVQNSPAAITVTAETSQPASTIVAANVAKIFSRMLPQSIGSSVWLANPTTIPELMTLSIAVGTGGAPVFLVDWRNAPTPTLLGRPIVFTEKVPAVGSAGCLGLYDFGMYLIGDRQAISLESSEHSRFATDETELRIILRNDGRPWIQSAITPLNGLTLSPFVMLGAVA